MGSGSCCAELDWETPRASRNPQHAVAVAAKSCNEGDFYECVWLGHALGRREPLVKDDAGYKVASRGADRLAAAGCRAGDLEICVAALHEFYGNQ